MKTEEEARQCWCPFARLSSSNSPEVGNHAANRWPGDEPRNRVPKAALCIASECMAWRWKVEPRPNPDGAASIETPFVPAHERGFCGLAGKP